MNSRNSVRCSHAAKGGRYKSRTHSGCFEQKSSQSASWRAFAATLCKGQFTKVSCFEFELLVNNIFFVLYNTVRYHVPSSSASLCEIFSFLPNYMEEGIFIAILGDKHKVRNKFSKRLGVRNN